MNVNYNFCLKMQTFNVFHNINVASEVKMYTFERQAWEKSIHIHFNIPYIRN